MAKDIITTPSLNGFMAKLPAKNVQNLGNGMVLFSTLESTNSIPLVIRKVNDPIDGGQLKVVREDYLTVDEIMQLFGDNPVMQEEQYSFNESAIIALIGNEPELLCDIVAFLDNHKFVDPEKFIGLLTALTKRGFPIFNVLLVLDSLSNAEIAKLFFIYDDESLDLRRAFSKLLANTIDPDDDEDE